MSCISEIMKSIRPKKKKPTYTSCELNAVQERKLMIKRKEFCVQFAHELRRKGDDYLPDEVDSMAMDLITYVLDESVIWYRDYFNERGISWDKVTELRKHHHSLDEALKLADSFLEARYVKIPFNKSYAQKHCAYLLSKALGGIWKEQSGALVEIHNSSIFSTLDTTPIIAVKECAKPAQSYAILELKPMEEAATTSNFNLMGPNSEEGPAA